MTRTPARLQPSTGEGGLDGESTHRAFLKPRAVLGLAIDTRNCTPLARITPYTSRGIARLIPVKRGTATKGYSGTLGTDPSATLAAVGR